MFFRGNYFKKICTSKCPTGPKEILMNEKGGFF